MMYLVEWEMQLNKYSIVVIDLIWQRKKINVLRRDEVFVLIWGRENIIVMRIV